MDSLLLNDEGVYCYIDDLLLFSASDEEHHLMAEKVFNNLANAGLSLQIDKCNLATPL